ncbi:MAG TPA: cupin domain-containing protein [Anaerolineales bacterium]|nr:cupin domain-containing protein [Anaerolineales bacterium]
MGTVLQRPIAISPGSGQVLKNLGVIHKMTSAQTGGAYYLCEAIFGPERGSPMHIHHYENEVITVLEGALDVRLDGEVLHVSPGGTVHLPKKFPHALQNPLKTPLKIMVYAIPGGLENYFSEVDAAIENGTFDQETHTKISANYGLEWLE